MSKTLKGKEALQALLDGEKLKRTYWNSDCYIWMTMTGRS